MNLDRQTVRVIAVVKEIRNGVVHGPHGFAWGSGEHGMRPGRVPGAEEEALLAAPS